MMFGLMYYFSTDVFSADNTRNIFEKIFLWFSPHASKRSILTFNTSPQVGAFHRIRVLGRFLFRAFRAAIRCDGGSSGRSNHSFSLQRGIIGRVFIRASTQKARWFDMDSLLIRAARCLFDRDLDHLRRALVRTAS
jgi:hypothetical protein